MVSRFIPLVLTVKTDAVQRFTRATRTGVERTNDAVKDFGLGHVRARGRVHARTEVFVALCLRLVVAITNFERGDDSGCEKLKL